MKSKRAEKYAKTIKEGVDMTNKRFVIEVDRKTEMIVSQECYPDYVYNQLVTVASLAEQDAEERHAEELKKSFNQGCWTCVQNVSSIVNRNDVANVLTDLVRGLGISEEEARILSSVDGFRREEIYDAMGWSHYWINNGGRSDE